MDATNNAVPDEFAGLRKLAEAATGGNWRAVFDIGNPVGVQWGVQTDEGLWVCDCLDNAGPRTGAGRPNAKLIAAANPSTILRLLDALAAATQPHPVAVSAPSDDSKRLSAYATLVKAKEGQIAQLQAELAKHSEAVNTLASERTANAMLTAELENTRAAAPVSQPQAAMPEVPKWERTVPLCPTDTEIINAMEEEINAYRAARPAPPSPQPVAKSAFDEFDRLRKLPKVVGFCWAARHTEREAFDLAVRNAEALQLVAGLTDDKLAQEVRDWFPDRAGQAEHFASAVMAGEPHWTKRQIKGVAK